MNSTSNMNTINSDPAMDFHSRYKNMKSKYRIEADCNMYGAMSYNVLLSMFEYDERMFRPDLFERILHDLGVVALIKTTTADYTPVFCYINGGDRYADGFFKNVTCFDMTGESYEFEDWRNNPNVFVFFNNLTYSADSFIDKYSYMLSELDTSIMCNVLFSRLKPIPIAKDGAAKAKIDQIFSDLTQGTIRTIVQELDLTDIVDNNRPSIEVLNLTDVESSKYIQYLSHLHDNLISRLFFMMGLSINDNGKQAQISIEELNKNKNAAISILNGWYFMRKMGFDEMRKKGVDMHFDFSPVWKSEIEVNVYQPEDQAKLDEMETEDKNIVDNNSEEPENIVDNNSDGAEDKNIVDNNSEEPENIVDNNSEESEDENKSEAEINININVNADEEDTSNDDNE